MAEPTDSLINEQIAYYRARAPEYDQWFLRQGRYDRGDEVNRRWFAEVDQLIAALAAFQPGGDVLELACGTGLWTQRLAQTAETLTAVDASPEMIALNRARSGNERVRYIQADLFTWRPDRHYDVVFFSFWLSHVPPEQFVPFWKLVRSCLKPDGRAFWIDSAYEEQSTAINHQLEGPDATTLTRRLNNGREYRIVKVFYYPGDLAARLAGLGWEATVQTTGTFFLYGSAQTMLRSAP